jgi:exodeoxyribonuclease V alpha subunit
MPELTVPEGSDFYFLDATEPEDALRKLLTLVTQRSGARPT